MSERALIEKQQEVESHARNLTGIKLYWWLIKNNYPQGYRTLCLNCNFSIGHFGYCPHKEVK